MAPYRKKPVVIEAVPVREILSQAARDWYGLPGWVREAYDGKNTAGVHGLVFTDTAVSITTLEGVMVGGLDDYLIRGVRGELYPCKPDIFLATYEAV